MKTNEAPEKIYLCSDENGTRYYTEGIPFEREYVEYIRTDTFIEKACEWLEAHSPFVNDDILDVWLDNFKEAMKL